MCPILMKKQNRMLELLDKHFKATFINKPCKINENILQIKVDFFSARNLKLYKKPNKKI